MSILAGDPLTQIAFSVFENKGVFAVLLGSGLSRAAEIPTGWEITLDLIRRVGLAQGEAEQADWAAWYRAKTGEEPNYSALLEELASSPDERRSILHSYIEPTEEDRAEGKKTPTPAHHAIAALVQAGYVRVIVTTNFDRLMENALRERGIEPTIVASPDALSGAEPIMHSACYILKLHGDYKDARILNTDAELADYPAKYKRLLDRIFDEHGLIVCGWSGEWDHALRAAILRTPSRRYPMYWTARGTPSGAGGEIVAQRRARVVTITDADSFFTGLQRRVETLEQTHRQNPLSIDLLVASAKRFLAKPEFRIQLDELFTEETSRLMERLDAPELTPQGSWSPAEFRDRVRRYEAASDALARMAGVLGRWGDGSELDLLIDIIRSLCAHAERIAGGLVVYIGLRSYPAVLIFNAYGIGLTRAQRWDTLNALFSAVIHREYQEPQRVVETLMLGAWKGAEGDPWKQLEGLDRRYTALSDHLFDVFTEWSKSFAGLSPDFALLFERFEFLAALAHLTASSYKENVRQALATQGGRNFVWMPIGREGWDSRNRDILLAEIAAAPLKENLLKAGFANGDPEFLEAFADNFRHMVGRMAWM